MTNSFRVTASWDSRSFQLGAAKLRSLVPWKKTADTDQTHHEHHHHAAQHDSSLCLSTERPREAERLQCLLHTHRRCTTEGPTPTDHCNISSRTYSSMLGLPRAGGNSGRSFPIFHFHENSKTGPDHETKYGTVPLNTLKTFSISYGECFQYINLRKLQWAGLTTRTCPQTLQRVLQGASTNPVDSLALTAAPSFMGWLAAANQSPSEKKRSWSTCLKAGAHVISSPTSAAKHEG